MFRQLNQVLEPIKPNAKILVAASGGVDSLVLLHMFNTCNEGRVSALFIHHGTSSSEHGLAALSKFCKAQGIQLVIKSIQVEGESNKEMRWRDERYKIFHSYGHYTVLTGHNLDDQVEQYLMSSIKGKVTLIPYKNGNVLRPLLYCKKADLIAYAIKHNIVWYDDPTNFDESNARAIVRNQIVAPALKVNPGLYKTVAKIVRDSSYVWK